MKRLVIRVFGRLGPMALGLCFLLGRPSEASATSGVMTVTSSKTLTENHHGVIVIAGNNITLDCAYNYLYENTATSTHICGANDDQSCGILIVGRSKPTIKRCRPRYFQIGMYLESVSQGKFHNNRFEYNVEGVRIQSSSSGVFDTNYYRYNDDEGLDVNGQSLWNEFYRSLFNGNGVDGADFGGVAQPRIEDSDFVDNGYNGLELDGCTMPFIFYNVFQDNGFASGSRNGLSFDNTDMAFVEDNYAFDNARDGFRVTDDSDGGQFTGNVASGNGQCDAREDSSSSNTWGGNSFQVSCL